MSIVTGELPGRCQRCSVRSRALCGVLTNGELTALNAASRQRTFDEGQTIVIEGEPAIVGNVISGVCVEKKTLPDGREQIVSLLFPADFIGGDLDGPSDTTVQAVSPVRLCLHDRASFARIVDEHPLLQRGYLEHARSELKNAREWMLLLGQKNAEERLATFLLRLATRHTEAGCSHYTPDDARDGMTVEIPISRAQIAAYLGLTLETVSRKIGALRDHGAITLEGTRSVTLSNVAKLQALAG